MKNATKNYGHLKKNRLTTVINSRCQKNLVIELKL